MRAKIIQYNGSDGTGTIFADGRQYPFAIGAWRSDSVPAAGRVVEIELQDDGITHVTAVPEDVLIRERAAEFGGKVSALAGTLSSQISSRWSAARSSGAAGADPGAVDSTAGTASAAVGTRADTGGAVLERYGKVLLGAYVVFVFATLALNAIKMSLLGQSTGWSLFGAAGFLGRVGVGGGGSIKLILVLAYAVALAPVASRDRKAWLGLAAPLVAILWASVTAVHLAASWGRGVAGEMASVFEPGFGLFVALAAAVVLAVGGVLRYRRSA